MKCIQLAMSADYSVIDLCVDFMEPPQARSQKAPNSWKNA